MWMIPALGIVALCGLCFFYWKRKAAKAKEKERKKKEWWESLSPEEKRAEALKSAWEREIGIRKLPRLCPGCHRQNYGQDENGFPTYSKWKLIPSETKKDMQCSHACPHCGYTIMN